jgi:hypothetical protein
MANPSKAKGTSWETAVVRYLGSRCLRSRRKALTGAFDEADIEVPELADLLVIEAKNCKGQSLAQWVDEAMAEAVNAGVPVGVVWHRRRLSARMQSPDPGNGYVTMSGGHFTDLMLEVIRLRVKVKQLEADLAWERHH